MTTDGKTTKMMGGTPGKKPESKDSVATTAPVGPAVTSTSPRGNPPTAKNLKRWTETRGLLQQALADWEKSEEKATEMLKEAESERANLEGLLLKLKAKLDELS